jgi:hypothetical protein
MGWIFKPFSILRALLLLPLAVFKPGDVAPAPVNPEDEAWTQSLSVGTPQALQEFISQYPHSSKVESAFDLMVNFQVETARARAWRNALEAQVAQDPEMLESDFDSY